MRKEWSSIGLVQHLGFAFSTIHPIVCPSNCIRIRTPMREQSILSSNQTQISMSSLRERQFQRLSAYQRMESFSVAWDETDKLVT